MRVMDIRGGILGGICGVALAALMVGGASAQDRCRSDDLVCRIDRLEANVERIIAYLESRQDDHRRPESRSVDVPTSYSCTGQGCAQLAVEACRQAGFARGVPAEIQTDSFGFTRMIRITCLD